MSEFVGNEPFTFVRTKQVVEGIARQIERGSWTPHMIIGLARGGLVPAVMLSYRLNIPMHSVAWSFRDANNSINDFTTTRALINKKDILVVDDIVDSGYTIKQFIDRHTKWSENIIKQQYAEYNLPKTRIGRIKTAALIYNKSQDFTVDFYGKLIDRNNEKQYFDFEWEV